MLHLTEQNIKEHKADWEAAGIRPYAFDRAAVQAETHKNPTWIHFGGGNIFRAFVAKNYQKLLESGAAKTGIVVAETYDEEVIEKVYRPYDNLSVDVTMYADGRYDKEVVGSIVAAYVCHPDHGEDWAELVRMFEQPSLQFASFTITEKGYAVKDHTGAFFPDVQKDLEAGPEEARSTMGRIAALAYRRYKAGAYPLTFLSMDNCSHNGDKVRAALMTFAEAWAENGKADKAFADYMGDGKQVSYPWSMIDKITPRSSPRVEKLLEDLSYGDAAPIHTAKGTYATYVNAEKAEYLVIEDSFRNGRPPLEKCGVIFTDRETVDRAERMKVCTCLNPLHTALAVYGCLLGYTLIADEMKDDRLVSLIRNMTFQEGLKVVVDPGVLSPKDFVQEVLTERFPNPNLPDTPQRIASDTSQKVGIRFGETIKAYGKEAGTLTYIPLAIAGWCRYLLGVDDAGKPFELSPDPMLPVLQKDLAGVTLGEPETGRGKLRPILSNAAIFGSNLYEAGIGEKVEGFFLEMLEGPLSVARLLERMRS